MMVQIQLVFIKANNGNMKLKALFILFIVCSSCASSKRLHDPHFSEIEYLLNTPDSISHYNVQYRNYFNWEEFVWDKLEVNIAEYNYHKLDSLLQWLTLNPQSWEASQLSGIYKKFEQEFFDEHDSFIKVKKWTLGADVDHGHILDDAISLVRNIDYLIYAKNRYGKNGFEDGYKIFKKECELREEFRKREKYKDWRLATKDFDEMDFFTSKKYRDHVIEGNIWPFCGKYTMLDRHVREHTEYFLNEIIEFKNGEFANNKALLFQPKYAYINELRQSLFGRWFYLLDSSFDDYILAELKVENSLGVNNELSRHIIRRGNRNSVFKVYDLWSRNLLIHSKLTRLEDNHCLVESSNTKSHDLIK